MNQRAVLNSSGAVVPVTAAAAAPPSGRPSPNVSAAQSTPAGCVTAVPPTLMRTSCA